MDTMKYWFINTSLLLEYHKTSFYMQKTDLKIFENRTGHSQSGRPRAAGGGHSQCLPYFKG